MCWRSAIETGWLVDPDGGSGFGSWICFLTRLTVLLIRLVITNKLRSLRKNAWFFWSFIGLGIEASRDGISQVPARRHCRSCMPEATARRWPIAILVGWRSMGRSTWFDWPTPNECLFSRCRVRTSLSSYGAGAGLIQGTVAPLDASQSRTAQRRNVFRVGSNGNLH